MGDTHDRRRTPSSKLIQLLHGPALADQLTHRGAARSFAGVSLEEAGTGATGSQTGFQMNLSSTASGMAARLLPSACSILAMDHSETKVRNLRHEPNRSTMKPLTA